MLGDDWGIGRQHVDQLAAHLPRLKHLTIVNACQPNFHAFAVALAARMPQLRVMAVKKPSTHVGE